jgi:hemolysin III
MTIVPIEASASKAAVPHEETNAEHIANAITHGIGAALSVAALILLIVVSSQHGDTRRVVTLTIYGVSLLVVYMASTCFHSVRPGTRYRRMLRVWDHAAIYMFIAGTYTPLLLVFVRGGWGWSLFGVLWGLALVGTLIKVHFVGRYDLVSTAVYIAMGWIGLLAIRPFLTMIPTGALWWLLAGGITYTIGVIFYLWERLRFSHAVWHLFVLGGSVCHFFALFLYVAPK